MRFFGVLALLSAALLGGCSSVAETRENPPILQLSSAHKAKDVAECIRDGWQGTTVLGAGIGGILQTSGDRYTILAPDAQSPLHLVDVIPNKGGSSIRYHFYRTWQSPLERVTDVVRSCAK